MRVLNTYRDWARRRDTAAQLRALSHRQLEDIGAFEAENAKRVAGLIDGI